MLLNVYFKTISEANIQSARKIHTGIVLHVKYPEETTVKFLKFGRPKKLL